MRWRANPLTGIWKNVLQEELDTLQNVLGGLLPQSHIRFSFLCCCTSTETIRLIRDGEPRTATSTFTQLLSSDTTTEIVSVLLYIHRNHQAY